MTRPVTNDSGKPEPLLTAAQWQALTALHGSEPDTGASQPAMGEPVTQPATPPAPPTPPAQPSAPTPPTPGHPAPPAPPAPPPGGGQFVAPTTPAQQSNGQAPVEPKTGDAADADGFPANTPITEMTAKQQAAYWKAQARKHEDRVKAQSDYDKYKTAFDEYQRLIAASQTEQEKAVAEARRQGRAEALNETGGQLVEQWVRAAAAGRLAEESVTALLAGLDRSRFLHENGGVDTDKVYQFVGSIAPAAVPVVPDGQGVPVNPAQPPVTAAPTRVPDFGQGTPSSARPSGLAAGREIARQRFGSPANSAAS
jgi:hypothetical protein